MLLGKGYGYGFDVILITDPVIRPIADWLSENENYAKIAFGAIGVALGVFTADIPAIIVGSVSLAEGIGGCIKGETVDSGADASRTVATTFGGDPDKAELVYLGTAGGVSAKGVGKAIKVLRAGEDVSGLSGAAKASKVVNEGMRDLEVDGNVSRPTFSIEPQTKSLDVFVRNAGGAIDCVEGSVDIAGKLQSASDLIERKREADYAGTSFAAVGYGY